MSRKLVAYFSASGVTSEIAETLSRAAGADLYEIKPEIPYTTADLDWKDSAARSTIEMQNPLSRPAISDSNADITSYDVIFIGFPIWWYVAPTIINTFLESYDFSQKTIVLFATSGGSGFGKTKERLQTSASPTTIWKEEKLFNGKHTEQDLAKWVESLNV